MNIYIPLDHQHAYTYLSYFSLRMELNTAESRVINLLLREIVQNRNICRSYLRK